MSDITMCNNNECPVKNDCYRHRAKTDSQWQAWSTFEYDKETLICKHFISIDGYTHLREVIE